MKPTREPQPLDEKVGHKQPYLCDCLRTTMRISISLALAACISRDSEFSEFFRDPQKRNPDFAPLIRKALSTRHSL